MTDTQSASSAAKPGLAPQLGAHLVPGGTRFRAWVTTTDDVAVRVNGDTHRMAPVGDDVYEVALPVGAGARYSFVLNGQVTPDPYARFMPDGVHADAEVIDPAFTWQHADFPGVSAEACVLYELHVGTFTPEGTYRAAMAKLPYLRDLGVTAIELMPLAAFPGERGWGYDGVMLYAPFAPYGRPEDLKAFIDAAHGHGLAVLNDVVYNHFGPDGNYLHAYSDRYFTDRFHTPWGQGLDYREPHMRRLILDNARMWLQEYRFDGLRLDATHEIHDDSPTHLLRELAREVRAMRGQHLLFAEDPRNLPALVTEDELTGVWADDFHHTVRVTLTGEHEGYYAPYAGGAAAIAHVINRGWSFEGQPWPLNDEPRGAPADALGAPSFVYTLQNHDQIGNRPTGDRLHHREDVTPAQYRAASLLLLTLPMTPLLFQGQEWAASTPFQYFTDHHGELGALVSEGRRREFQHFEGFAGGDVPDPQAAATFLNSTLNWAELDEGEHARTRALYRAALGLRRSDPVLRSPSRDTLHARADGDVLIVRRADEHGTRVLVWNLGGGPVDARTHADGGEIRLHSEARDDSTLQPGEAALLAVSA
ncbi:malto-oligosyltrehalose trehalohydrolase [Deinococcus maricopensis]|uniref:Malto-oligosyltrehalose trehalohydrolase n=1 Tax=Deinococcus maricopensis (strain DSM 21211 / LMG 22137 / NRRL B-23946 / LB-34) TaxID=709986 RepID=E8U8R4_DEIML|nr:malto-oligosyltrehalose trehalohydrolase [Deinococcus maricopensis]ADV67453.1 malto-oligosyltrehalose trehalohydrolase [Deinococcus maricopensis DSM 21211]